MRFEHLSQSFHHGAITGVFRLPLFFIIIMHIFVNNYGILPSPLFAKLTSGMDVCLRKPLLVTCGSDHTVRIWNYLDKTIEIMQSFPEEPHSVWSCLGCEFEVIVDLIDILFLCSFVYL